MKNKGKAIMAISIGLSGFALTMVMCMQFKMVNETDIMAIENMRETELRTALSEWKQKYEEVDQRYLDVTKKISEYENQEISDNESSKLMQNELTQINSLMGKTNVQGQGIIITLKDSENTDMSINASDLLVVVNSLKLAGAEAISINEERIINMSDIVEINNTFIKINGQRILGPYVIKAIGDKEYLQSSLQGKGGYADELKKIGFDVTIQQENKINISKYKDEITTKYMQ